MITLTEYLNNPCGNLSIPYWKAKNIVITTATQKDIKTIVQIINDSYTDISLNKELIRSYTKIPVYNEEL